MKTITFFRHFLDDVMIGAVAPTSKFAVKRLCRKVSPENAQVVVEYGPGTGVFSHKLLEVMRKDSKLVLIETNSHFCDRLKEIDDPRVHVYNDSACNVREILDDCGEECADYVVSGIPFSMIPEDTRKEIMENTRDVLSGNGRFLVYQYSTFVKKHLKQHFSLIDTDLTVLNFPPLFVMEVGH